MISYTGDSNRVWLPWRYVEQLVLLYDVSSEGIRMMEECNYLSYWDLIHHLLPLTFTQVSIIFSP